MSLLAAGVSDIRSIGPVTLGAHGSEQPPWAAGRVMLQGRRGTAFNKVPLVPLRGLLGMESPLGHVTVVPCPCCCRTLRSDVSVTLLGPTVLLRACLGPITGARVWTLRSFAGF